MGVPGVTVVVPTHDRPELMRRAVSSVLAQDYAGPVEVVVVFDGTDPVAVPAPAARGRAVRTLRNTRTRGLAGARNSGILAATHEYVAFLDDDDEWLTGKLTHQVPLLEEHPDAAVAGAGMRVVTPSGAVDRPIPLDPVTHADLLRDRLTQLNACGILARRDALLGDLGLVDEAIPGSYGEDYDLLLRAARIAPIPVLAEPAVVVHWHGHSLFASRWRMIADALQYLLAKHPGFRQHPRGYGRVAGQIAFAEASQGHRRAAAGWAGRALRHDPTQPRALLALAVAARLISPQRVLATLTARGRGV